MLSQLFSMARSQRGNDTAFLFIAIQDINSQKNDEPHNHHNRFFFLPSVKEIVDLK